MIGALNRLRFENGRENLSVAETRAHVSHGAVRLVRVGFPDVDDAALEALRLRFLQLYAQNLADGPCLFPGIEQVLAAHSQIEATAELPVIAQLLNSVGQDHRLPGGTPMARLAHIDAARARALGDQYLDRASQYRGTDRPRFVDKMPGNWLYIGFIRLILPNATIIDARRHPLAAGFSNFRQHYGRGAGWTYSLPSIGRYYREYLRMMRHFDRVLPGQVHRVIHEQVVDDFEPEVRRLLDHVGVPFEPACLEFHRSTGPVRSASAEQVRRPVSRDGVDRWRAFEPWLLPLKDALGDALKDWRR
jgi:hypothetical protein